MPQTGPNSSDGPDFFEALRGMAHLSDYARKMMGESDPQTRKQVEMLGDANVKDVVEAVGDQLDSSTPETHMDLRDTDYGIEVLIDTSDTPVNPSNVTTVYDGTDLTLMDPQVGWEASVTTKAPIKNVTVDPSDAGLATVKVQIEGAEGDPDRDSAGVNDSPDPEDDEVTDDEPTESTPAMTDDNTPDQEDTAQVDDNILKLLSEVDPSKTLNEVLEEHPELKEKAKKMLGESEFTMALTFVGDTPIQDIPFDEYAPDDVDIPGDLDVGGDGEDSSTFNMEQDGEFTFDGDPLSQDDDE